jgi:hypothetical protein
LGPEISQGETSPPQGTSYIEVRLRLSTHLQLLHPAILLLLLSFFNSKIQIHLTAQSIPMAVLEFIGDQLLRPNRAVVFGLGAIAGLAMHHGFYIHGEWHVQAPAIVVGHSLAFAALYIGSVSSSFAGGTLTLESKFVFRYPGFAILGYLVALFTSITVYRLFFNRLARAGFAGPVGARITKLWHMWACRGSKNHLVLDRLHRKYGNFVRTGKEEEEALWSFAESRSSLTAPQDRPRLLSFIRTFTG